jgi:hypothetical protein
MSVRTAGPSNDESFSDEETARRRDAALLNALSTPHKKQADMKTGKPRGKSAVKKSSPKPNASDA